MLDGRVKTLHPRVHGGLLYIRGNKEHEAAVAAHGIEFPCGDPHQRTEQGALVCNDWRPGGIAPTQFFSAADVDASANLSGAIACAFACYGGGTPAMVSIVVG